MKLLKFKQNNCTPCKMVDQFIVEDLKTDADETLILFSGDKRADELAAKYGVMQTPTLVLVGDNEEVIDIVRGVGQAKIRGIFEKRGLI
ncbi:thioredoxin [Geobacillus phage GR1]|nr:thioredoxin [Geobacillus phage GR1]